MKRMIGIDQYNKVYYLEGKHPRKELLDNLNCSSADKMYVDRKDGSSFHCGYIIGDLWIRLFWLERVEL